MKMIKTEYGDMKKIYTKGYLDGFQDAYARITEVLNSELEAIKERAKEAEEEA